MESVENINIPLLDLKEEAFRSYLIEQKCVFHPKVSAELNPIVDPKKLEAVFGPNQQDVSEVLIPVLNKYVQMVPITDPFTDHHDRRAWRQTLPDPIRKFYENKNQLRVNNINSVCAALSVMEEFCPESILKQKCQTIINAILCGFTDLNDDQKINFVKQLEEKIREILKYLS
jgi:hypothetical protein